MFTDSFCKSVDYRYRDVEDKIPWLYAIAKMHKTPKAFRFITNSSDTVTSKLSITVAKCLKLLLNTSRTSFKYRIKHIDNTVFVIDNRDKVIDFMDISNAKGEPRKCISTWDFSTLYTNIPHDKLISKMTSFVKKLFNANPEKPYICCSDKGRSAYWSKSISKKNITFSCDELIDSIDFIVNNSFITFHNLVYRQIVGIPMGTNCAPFLANVFLHYMNMNI